MASYASPIGGETRSIDVPSPLRVYRINVAHGNGETPKYVRPSERYEEGGALKSAMPSQTLRSLYDSGILKDPLGLLKNAYNAKIDTNRLYVSGDNPIMGDLYQLDISSRYKDLRGNSLFYNMN